MSVVLEIGELVDRVKALRAIADMANDDAARLIREGVLLLRAEGITLRDIGSLLQISYQRVQQIEAQG